MHREQSDRLAASIVEFCRFARSRGVAAHPGQTITALEAVKTINPTDQQSLTSVLQSALCSTGEEWDIFPELFDEFWGESRSRARSASGEHKGPSNKNRHDREAGSTVFLDQPGNESAAGNGDGKAVYGASAQQRLKRVDFSEVPCDDLPALEELSLRLLRRMGQRLSRRLTINNLASRVDLRRTIRRSIAHGGDPLVLAYKSRQPRKNRLIIFLDISGSMNFYSLFLMRFAYALQRHFQRVDTFLFSTNVVEISDLLRTRHLPEALRRLSQRAAGWSGGTKIGESLRQFNQLYGRKLLSRDTVFMVLSDGWDTGEPEVLAAQLRAAKRRAQRILWLNPLLGLKDYQPITRGMAAALPYVDVFAPAHNLESLLALERHL
ncbi:MAG: VWA domain-containing protein [Silvibacterium sp.]